MKEDICNQPLSTKATQQDLLEDSVVDEYGNTAKMANVYCVEKSKEDILCAMELKSFAIGL